MMCPVSISIITPSYQQGDFLERMLASVSNQSHPVIEHLVYDGGSTDRSVEILRAAGSRVRWVSRPDGGQADAVNQGLWSATGEVIGWINSDDIYYPEAFESIAAAFAADPDLDVVYGEADHIDVFDNPFEAYPTAPWDPEWLRHDCFICQPALFFRRRVVGRVGVLDPNLHYCMDYNYWLRLAAHGCRFRFLPRKLAGSRLYASNKTLRDRAAVHREIARMFHTLEGSVPLRWVYAEARYRTLASIDEQRFPGRFAVGLMANVLRSQWHWNRRPGVAALWEYAQIRRRHAARVCSASS
jgi:glycosyltransferase involved in cell wall biosynthesis